VAAAYADALTPVFLVLVVPVAVGAGLLLLVRRLHLSTSFEEGDQRGERGGARGSHGIRESHGIRDTSDSRVEQRS
jgi:hypothetical protein